MTSFLVFVLILMISTNFCTGQNYPPTSSTPTTMWTPYYLSSTTGFDFNKDQKNAVQQIQESIKNPYDWQGNKNEHYSSRTEQQYKYPSQYFAAQEAARNQQNNERLNHRNRQQNIYSPPQNYNQQDPKYKYENRLQGQDRRISSSSLNAIEQNQQQQLTQPPKSYENRNQNQYNNNQQAQHSRQLP